jgi:hypothetical protein
VEQVTISALEGPVWDFAAIPSEGITDAVEVLVFLIWQLLHWPLFGCKKQPGGAEGDRYAKRQSGNATDPTGGCLTIPNERQAAFRAS